MPNLHASNCTAQVTYDALRLVIIFYRSYPPGPSIDTKDRVKVGDFSRGGSSRVIVKAGDHDFGGDYLTPLDLPIASETLAKAIRRSEPLSLFRVSLKISLHFPKILSIMFLYSFVLFVLFLWLLTIKHNSKDTSLFLLKLTSYFLLMPYLILPFLYS